MSAYLKGEEPKVVTSEDIRKLSRASNIQDALAIIRETDVGSYLEEMSIKTFDDLDECLWGYFVQRIKYLESFKFLPDAMRRVSRTYIVKYDVSNLKAAVQGISRGKRSPMIPAGLMHNNGLLGELSQSEKVGDIIGLLTQSKLGGYVPILKEYEVAGGAISQLLVEARLDGEYYKSMLNMAKDIRDGSVLSKALGLIIDLTNLQIASRAIIETIGTDAAECVIPGGYMITDKAIRDLLASKLSDVPRKLEGSQYQDVAKEILGTYDKTNSITAVDEVIDKYKLRWLKGILSPRVLSPLVMAWYLILKEVEIRNLRIILKTIADGIPAEEIKEYLVS